MLNRVLKQQERRSLLFGEMLRRFLFDTHRDMTMSDAMTLGRAISKCRSCSATGRCEVWMASTDGTEGADQFCPNVEAFRRLRGPTGS